MYIFSPKTRRRIFLDNAISDYETRLEKVKELAFTDEILDYAYQNRFIWSKRQEQAYLNAEHILENIATYLLMGQFKGHNIMTLHKIRKAKQMELPESSTDSNAGDLMYGIDTGSGKDSFSFNASTEMSGKRVQKDKLIMSVEEIRQTEERDKKQAKRYKGSKTYRMEKLFSTRPVPTYRLVPVKDKGEDGKEKIAKNVFGQPIFIDVRTTIGGRQGLIDRSKPFIGKWCIVDTENLFKFNGECFEIDKSLKQYKVGRDNKSEMDKVLAYYIPHENKYLFFDVDIKDITLSVKRKGASE